MSKKLKVIKLTWFIKKKLEMGRRYAEHGLSLQMFSKKIRQSLVYDTHLDIDIVNCHLVLISQYCKKNHISCPSIDDYNSKRSSRIQELITKCNITRKVAKEFILTMMYLGQSGDYCANHGFSGIPPAWCGDLANEFVAITDLCSLSLFWDDFYEEYHRMVLATFWVVGWVEGENHENNKIKGRRKSALLPDAPLKLPPDWLNWLAPIAVFLLAGFY